MEAAVPQAHCRAVSRSAGEAALAREDDERILKELAREV